MEDNKNSTTSINFIDNEEKTIWDFLKIAIGIVWKYKLLIFLVTFIGAAGSVAFSMATLMLPQDRNPLPNIYRAYTRVLIQEGSLDDNDSMALMLNMFGMGNQGSSSGASETLIQMVYNSYPFADRVIKEFNIIEKYSIVTDVKTHSRRIFYLNSSLAYDSRSGELTISFTDTDKYLATEIVNFILAELQRWFYEQGGAVSLNQLNNIESKLMEVNAEINRLEEKIKSMQLKYGVLNIEDLAQAQQRLANNLNEQLMNLDLQISQQENARSSYSPVELGMVKSLKGQREDVALTLANLEAGLIVGGRAYPPAEDLPNIARDFEELQLFLEIQNGIYLSLTEQYEMLKLSTGGDLSFTVLEPAEVPERKFGPRRGILCIQVTFLSGVLSLCIAFLHYFIKLKKRSSKS